MFAAPREVVVEGQLPDDGRHAVKLRVAGVVPWLVMKGRALDGRLKEKDAYDIEYVVRLCPGGPWR